MRYSFERETGKQVLGLVFDKPAHPLESVPLKDACLGERAEKIPPTFSVRLYER